MARKRDKTQPARSRGHNARMDSWDWKQRVKRERRRLEKDETAAICWLCSEPIDMTLPDNHRESFTLDHLVPLGAGGELDGDSAPAHRHCNSSRKDGKKTKRAARPKTFINW